MKPLEVLKILIFTAITISVKEPCEATTHDLVSSPILKEIELKKSFLYKRNPVPSSPTSKTVYSKQTETTKRAATADTLPTYAGRNASYNAAYPPNKPHDGKGRFPATKRTDPVRKIGGPYPGIFGPYPPGIGAPMFYPGQPPLFPTGVPVGAFSPGTPVGYKKPTDKPKKPAPSKTKLKPKPKPDTTKSKGGHCDCAKLQGKDEHSSSDSHKYPHGPHTSSHAPENTSCPCAKSKRPPIKKPDSYDSYKHSTPEYHATHAPTTPCPYKHNHGHSTAEHLSNIQNFVHSVIDKVQKAQATDMPDVSDPPSTLEASEENNQPRKFTREIPTSVEAYSNPPPYFQTYRNFPINYNYYSGEYPEYVPPPPSEEQRQYKYHQDSSHYVDHSTDGYSHHPYGSSYPDYTARLPSNPSHHPELPRKVICKLKHRPKVAQPPPDDEENKGHERESQPYPHDYYVETPPVPPVTKKPCPYKLRLQQLHSSEDAHSHDSHDFHIESAPPPPVTKKPCPYKLRALSAAESSITPTYSSPSPAESPPPSSNSPQATTYTNDSSQPTQSGASGSQGTSNNPIQATFTHEQAGTHNVVLYKPNPKEIIQSGTSITVPLPLPFWMDSKPQISNSQQQPATVTYKLDLHPDLMTKLTTPIEISPQATAGTAQIQSYNNLVALNSANPYIAYSTSGQPVAISPLTSSPSVQPVVVVESTPKVSPVVYPTSASPSPNIQSLLLNVPTNFDYQQIADTTTSPATTTLAYIPAPVKPPTTVVAGPYLSNYGVLPPVSDYGYLMSQDAPSYESPSVLSSSQLLSYLNRQAKRTPPSRKVIPSNYYLIDKDDLEDLKTSTTEDSHLENIPPPPEIVHLAVHPRKEHASYDEVDSNQPLAFPDPFFKIPGITPKPYSQSSFDSDRESRFSQVFNMNNEAIEGLLANKDSVRATRGATKTRRVLSVYPSTVKLKVRRGRSNEVGGGIKNQQGGKSSVRITLPQSVSSVRISSRSDTTGVDKESTR